MITRLKQVYAGSFVDNNITLQLFVADKVLTQRAYLVLLSTRLADDAHDLTEVEVLAVDVSDDGGRRVNHKDILFAG